MKKIALLFFCFTAVHAAEAQLLKKLKDKVNNAVDKTVNKTADKPAEKTDDNKTAPANTGEANNKNGGTTAASSGKPSLTVYSKFDFVPGKTILYFDNFENDNLGETPWAGILTSLLKWCRLMDWKESGLD